MLNSSPRLQQPVGRKTWLRIKEVFADASDLPEAERAAFLDQAVSGDSKVRNEVLRLLREDAGAEERLDALKPPIGLVRSAADRHSFYPGELLDGRYQIRRFVAMGGMGEVYEAEDLQHGQRVAIKTIRGELSGGDHLHSLTREVRAAHRIQHPNICRVFDLVRTETSDGRGSVFLTMEFLEGETLSERLHRDGAMSERQLLPLVRQMVAALAAAHQAGVVHRDFKTGNIMLVPRAGGATRVVITDFGLARQMPADRRATAADWSRSSMAVGGTPAYMAPEQIEGGSAGPASDIYSLGVVLYEAVTGEFPYPEDSPLSMAVKKSSQRPARPETLAPGLRRTWSAAILRCLEANPKNRFADVREVLTHLETRSRRRLWWKLLRRRHGRALKAVAALAAVAGVAALALWLRPPEPRAEAVRDWEQGILSLQAGEPVIAARRIESALAQHRLPAVAHAYLALAWHEAGFEAKARDELDQALRKPLQPEPDRWFAQAVEAQLEGRPEPAHALLKRRASQTGQVTALADLALFEDSVGKAESDTRWRQVAAQSPNHPAAHLRVAMAQAKQKRWKDAEREFLLAEAYFEAGGDDPMVRAVSARRGFARIENGDVELARHDLPALLGFQPRPHGAGYGPCERKVTLMAGQADHFALPSDPVPYVNPDFARNSGWRSKGRLKQFDELHADQGTLVSLLLPSLCYCGGHFEIGVKKLVTGAFNDMVNYGSATSDRGTAWSGRAESLWVDAPDQTERVMTREIGPDFLLDVQMAQHARKVTSLDFSFGDDTTVDYIRLTLVY